MYTHLPSSLAVPSTVTKPALSCQFCGGSGCGGGGGGNGGGGMKNERVGSSRLSKGACLPPTLPLAALGHLWPRFVRTFHVRPSSIPRLRRAAFCPGTAFFSLLVFRGLFLHPCEEDHYQTTTPQGNQLTSPSQHGLLRTATVRAVRGVHTRADLALWHRTAPYCTAPHTPAYKQNIIARARHMASCTGEDATHRSAAPPPPRSPALVRVPILVPTLLVVLNLR